MIALGGLCLFLSPRLRRCKQKSLNQGAVALMPHTKMGPFYYSHPGSKKNRASHFRRGKNRDLTIKDAPDSPAWLF